MAYRTQVLDTIDIGKIVRSESHVRYTCQIYGPGEVAVPPEPADLLSEGRVSFGKQEWETSG